MTGLMIFEDCSVVAVGDRVKQVAPIGLGNFYEVRHVVEVVGEGLLLSKEAGGSPLTDLRGRPMLYPRNKFHKIFY